LAQWVRDLIYLLEEVWLGAKMIEYFKTWIAPTVADLDIAYRQRLLKILLVFLAGAALLGVAADLVLIPLQQSQGEGLFYGCVLLLGCVLSGAFAQQGRIVLATLIVTFALFAVMMANGLIYGITPVVIVAFGVCILINATLLGIKSAIVSVLISIIAVNLVSMDQNSTRTAIWADRMIALQDSVYLGIGLFVLVGFSWLANQELSRLVRRERLLAERLREHSQHLEQQVEDRTAELSQKTDALQTSEETYRTLVRNLPNGAVFWFDHDLRYKIADGTILPALGVSEEFLEGKTIWEIWPPDLCQFLEIQYRAVLNGETIVIEVPYRDRIYFGHLLPIRNTQGQVAAGIAVVQDITDSKRSEAELIQAKELI
jgi:PAS domain S-box-containing protein